MGNDGKIILAMLLTSSFCLLSPITQADSSNNPGKGHGHWFKSHGNSHGNSRSNQAGKNSKATSVIFSSQDKDIIDKYFDAKPMGVTTLPPGIAKNLARGKPLPPGIQKVFLPSDLLSTLPNYPGYEYLAAGKDVLLVNKTTNLVADILANSVK
jgi:hypothetical protein